MKHKYQFINRFQHVIQPIKKLLIYTIIFQLAVPVPHVYAAPIEVDPNNPVTNTPTLDKAQNGVDIVNIANPTTGGVSANKFREYNVPNSGVIMNNSTEISRSQLGGVINANQNLTDGRSASLVLFQVTGTGRTNINGYSEMHGAQADFIMSNPNGISINGGGFIGTPRVTLTTGTPGFDGNGNIGDFTVQNGDIRIEGAGFNASNIDYVSVWARSMSLHGEIYGKNTDIVLGRNQINYANRGITPLADDGSGKPSFALDGSQVGSMYFDTIKLISTEDGVGVRSLADIAAQSGKLEIQSNGKLIYNNIYAKTDADLSAKGSVEQTGSSHAENNLSIQSDTGISLKGKSVKSGKTISIQSKGDITLEKTENVGDGITYLDGETAEIKTDQQLTLQNADSKVTDTFVLDASGKLVIQESRLEATSHTVKASDIESNSSDIVGGSGGISVESDNLTQTNSNMAAKGQVDVAVTETLKNDNSTIQSDEAGINLSAQTLQNTNQSSIYAEETLSVTSTELENTNSDIVAAGAGDHQFTATNKLTNSGSITGIGSLVFVANDIDNQNGTIQSISNLEFSSQQLNNNSGTLLALGDLTWTGSSFTNQSGKVTIGNNGTFTASDIVDNSSGTIEGGAGLLHISAENDIKNENGSIAALGDIKLEVKSDYTTAGSISASKNLDISASSITNKTALEAGQNLALTTTSGSLDNQSSIFANSSVNLNSAQALQNSGAIESAGIMTLQSGSGFDITNSVLGTISSSGLLTIHSGRHLVNDGIIGSYTELDLNAAVVTNNGQLASGGSLGIRATDRIHNSGLLFSATDMQLLADKSLYNDSDILSFGNLTIENLSGGKNNQVDNVYGLIEADGTFTVRAKQINNIGHLETQTKTDWSHNYWSHPSSTRKRYHSLQSYTDLKPNSHIQAYMGSRGKMTLDGNVYNYVSVLASGDDIHITGDLDNQGVDFTKHYNVNTYDWEVVDSKKVFDHYESVKRTRRKTKYYSCWVIFRCKKTVAETYYENVARYRYDPVYDWVSEGSHSEDPVWKTVSAVAQAKGTVKVDGKIKNGSVTNGASYTARKGPDDKDDFMPTDISIKSLKSGEIDIASGITLPDSDTGLFAVTLDSVSGGSGKKEGTPGHRYLIETNSEFIDTKKFLGSSYFLDRMGFDSDEATIKLLGDAFYETRLIRETIMQLSNRRYLSFDFESDYEQMQALYDNALEIATLFGLNVGDKLTDDQINALDKDMLWLVETDVNGEKVLAPRLYLSKDTRSRLLEQQNDGSVIAATDIVAQGGQDISNAGLFDAQNNILLNADNINNSGVFQAGNRLQMDAAGNLSNAGLMQADTVFANAASLDNSGEINGNTVDLNSRSDFSNSGALQAEQSLTAKAGGTLTNEGSIASKGSTALQSIKDLINKAKGRISGKTSVSLESTDGNITNETGVAKHDLKGYSTETIKGRGIIESDGSLRLKAGKDITNDGAVIEAAGDASLVAGGDINLNATSLDQEVNYGETREEKRLVSNSPFSSGTLGGYSVVSETIDETVSITSKKHSGSTTKIGGKLSMSSGGNTTLSGSELSVGGDANIKTGGDFTVQSLSNTNKEVNNQEKFEFTEVDNVAAKLNAGGSLTVDSGKSISVSGSEVKAGKTAVLDAEENINVTSVEKIRDFNNQEFYNKDTKITQEKSSLEAGENLVLKSGKDTTVVASDVSSGKTTAVKAGGDFNLLSAQDQQHNSRYEYDSGEWFNGSKKKWVDESKKTNVASNLNAGENLLIETGGDTSVLGSNIDVEGHAVVQSQGNVNFLAGNNTSSYSDKSKENGFAGLSSKKGRSVAVKNEKVGSNINVGGGFIVESDGEMLVQATNIEAGAVDVNAKKGISALSAENSDYTYSESSSSVLGGFLYKDHKENEKLKITHTESVVDSKEDVSLQTEGSITIGGSQINSGGNTNLKAAKDVTITSVAETEYERHLKEQSGFSGISVSTTRSSASLNFESKGSRDETETTTLTQKGSQLNVAGNLNIESGESTTVMGSDVVAGGDIGLKGREINVLSAEESQEIMEKHAETKDTISLTVGNAWVETAYAAKDAYESAQNAYNAGQNMDTSTEEGRINKAAADLQAGMSGARLANTMAQASGSSAFGGFYGSVSASHEETEKRTNTKSTSARSSQIISHRGNVDMAAEEALTIQGGAVAALQGDVSLSGDEVNILSAENKTTTTWGTEHRKTTDELFNTSGFNSLPTHSENNANGSSTSTTHTHSLVQAGNGKLSIKSNKDTTVKGAQVEGKDVALDVGGNLNVAYVQNTSSSESKSNGYSIGASTGFNKGASNANRKWTDTQTHIVGTEKMDVKAKKLELEGAVIANADIERDESGKVTGMTDKGGLSVEVDELVVKDLEDTDTADSYSYGVNVSGFTGFPQVPQGGSTQLNGSSSGHTKKGKSTGTLGQGTVASQKTTIVTDDPNKDSVNRNLAKRQEITEDTKKGDLQFSLDMDNRLVTDTGNYVKETAENTVNLAGNTLTTARRTGQAGTDLLDATVKDLQGEKGVRANGGVIGDFLTKTQLRQASIDFAKADKKNADVLKNPDKYTPQERDAALHSFNTYAAKEFGVDAPTSTSGYNGDELAKNQAQDQAMADGESILKSQQAGLYDKDRGSIHINDQAQDGSTEALVKVDGHELKHHIDAGKKQETDEHGANRFGNQAYNALSDEIGSGSQGDFSSHQQWTQTHTENGNFDLGNQFAANAENVDACGGLCTGALLLGVSALSASGTDYLGQGLVNKFKKDMSAKDAFHLKNIDKKSLAVSGGFGLVGGAGGQVASKVIQGAKLSKTAATVTSLAANSSIDAGVSAGSQYAKDGNVQAHKTALDVLGGYIGGKVGDKVLKVRQNSSQARKLHSETSELSHIKSTQPKLLKEQLKQHKNTKTQAENFGKASSIGTGTAAGNFTSTLLDQAQSSEGSQNEK
jgi:filamentous hemagglutinin